MSRAFKYLMSLVLFDMVILAFMVMQIVNGIDTPHVSFFDAQLKFLLSFL